MGVMTHSYALQPDDLLSAKIQSLCPTISGNVCCTEAQFDTLRAQVQQVRPHHLRAHTHKQIYVHIFIYENKY
jgi:hypothetical protein